VDAIFGRDLRIRPGSSWAGIDLALDPGYNFVRTKGHMVKKLSRIGNSLGVILDRPVLELLQIDETTPLEITTDGDVLTLRPVRGDKKDRVRASAAKMVKAHAKTLAKLAK
jgi:antitoxin MazE